MSLIERHPPGQVLARVSLDDCLRARPRRPMPPDIARWAADLPVPAPLAEMGLSGPLREAVSPLWAAVLARFQEGLRIEAGEDARVVVHCDTVRYEFTRRGAVHAFMPRLGGGYEPMPVEVGTPFPSWHWVRLLAMREPEAVQPLMQSIHVHRLAGTVPANTLPGGVEQQALLWLANVIEGLARRCIDGLRMREHLRAALAIDPDLLHAARMARPRRYARCDVPIDWWNQCVERREALLELRTHAPGLLPLYGEMVARGQISPRIRTVALLREAICKDLGSADWKRLARESPRPVWVMYRNQQIRSPQSLQGLLSDWARLHRGLPAGMRMPLAMFDPLARTAVGPLSDHVLPPVAWPGTPAATRQAILNYLQVRARGNGRRFIEDEWGPVVRWAADYAVNGRSPVHHWSTLRRLAAEDERKLRAGLAGQRWTSPLPEFEDARFRAVALCTGEELAEEAIAMRHCADRFVRDCAEGRLAIYSVRDRGTGKRLASVSVAIAGDGASLQDVARSLNRQPDDIELAFAWRLATAVSDKVKAKAQAKSHRELPIPPIGAKAIYTERKDSDVYAFVEATPNGWKGYKVTPSGTVRRISGLEAVDTLNPNSWAPMAREDFISAVTALRIMRQPQARAEAGPSPDEGNAGREGGVETSYPTGPNADQHLHDAWMAGMSAEDMQKATQRASDLLASKEVGAAAEAAAPSCSEWLDGVLERNPGLSRETAEAMLRAFGG